MRASDLVELVAVASRDGDRAAQYARANGIPRAHAGYEALLEDPDVEAVYISLPNDGHVPWSRRALEAGKHVLCEKPLTRRAAEVDEVFDVAERAGRFLVEAFFWRHHPQTRRLAELVRDGAIGELRLMRAVFSHNATPKPGDVRLQGDLDGGALMDVGCYCVSGMRLLAGEPAAVTAQQVVGGNGVDVRFAGTLRWDGIVGTLDCGLDLPDRDELEVIGSEGTLFLDDPWHGRATGIELRRRGRRGGDRRCRRPTPTRPRSRTSRARSAAAASRCSAAPTRSGRRARSRRSTGRPRSGARWRSSGHHWGRCGPCWSRCSSPRSSRPPLRPRPGRGRRAPSR